MRRIIILFSLILFSLPASAITIIMHNGSGHDCYLRTLAPPTLENSRIALAACDLAVKDSAGDPDEYNRAAAYVNRGDIRLRLQDYAGALQDSEAAIALRPDLPQGHLNRGAGLVGLKRFQDALPVLDKVIAMAPDTLESAYFDRALAKESLGDIVGAYHDYLKAVQINPKFEMAIEELARFKVTNTPS
jgi:tetratricopeptide (TPR) repeat protein